MSTNNDGWILIAQRKPVQADLPVWMWGKEVGDADPRLYKIILPFLSDTRYTHWKPAAADIPAPPREKTQEDKDNDALLEWIGALGLPPTNVCVWEAALAYERAEVFKLLPDSDEIMIKGGQALNNYKALIARCGGGK